MLHSLAVTDAALKYGIKVQIDYRMMSGFSSGRAMLEIIGLMILVTAFIGMWMLLTSLWFGKMTAVVSATAFAVLPAAAANVPRERLRVSSPSFGMAMAMLFTGSVLLTAGAVLAIRRTEFQWTKED